MILAHSSGITPFDQILLKNTTKYSFQLPVNAIRNSLVTPSWPGDLFNLQLSRQKFSSSKVKFESKDGSKRSDKTVSIH